MVKNIIIRASNKKLIFMSKEIIAGEKGCPCNVSRPTIINFPPSSIGKGKRLKRATLILINAREVKNTSRPE